MKREYFTRYSDNDCVIVAKLFRAPITHYYKKLRELKDNGKINFNIEFNFEFYLRFYFPKKQMTTINSKSDQLIIMFNGLNEVKDLNFSLYDRLGRSFASQGFPAVLFPTPFHLNRAAIETSEDDDSREERPKKLPDNFIKKPTDPLEKRPYCLYMNFIQIIYEYKIFRHLISHEFDNIKCKSYWIATPNKEEKYFYNQHFKHKKNDISLLGYSLGGLMALSCFASDSERINSCALLNSGAALDEMNLTKFVDKKVWEKIAGNLKTVVNWGCDKTTVNEILEDPNYEIIQKVFFNSPFEENIDKVGKKLIFIMGGKDQIINPDSIKRLEQKDYVLTKIVIGELEHLLFDDVEFNHWYSRVINILIDFFNEPSEIALSKREAFNCLLSFHGLCNGDLFPNVSNKFNILTARNNLKNELLSILDDNDLVNKIVSLFDNIYRILSSYTDEENYILKHIHSKSKKLRFGKYIVNFCKGHRNPKKLKEMENDLKKFKRKKNKVGHWLIENEYITNIERDGALKNQLIDYKKFAESGKIGKPLLLPIFNLKLEKLDILQRG